MKLLNIACSHSCTEYWGWAETSKRSWGFNWGRENTSEDRSWKPQTCWRTFSQLTRVKEDTGESWVIGVCHTVKAPTTRPDGVWKGNPPPKVSHMVDRGWTVAFLILGVRRGLEGTSRSAGGWGRAQCNSGVTWKSWAQHGNGGWQMQGILKENPGSVLTAYGTAGSISHEWLAPGLCAWWMTRRMTKRIREAGREMGPEDSPT